MGPDLHFAGAMMSTCYYLISTYISIKTQRLLARALCSANYISSMTLLVWANCPEYLVDNPEWRNQSTRKTNHRIPTIGIICTYGYEVPGLNMDSDGTLIVLKLYFLMGAVTHYKQHTRPIKYVKTKTPFSAYGDFEVL